MFIAISLICLICEPSVAKVDFDIGIDSVRGILMGDDPYYIRRYPERGGGVIYVFYVNNENYENNTKLETDPVQSKVERKELRRAVKLKFICHL